MKPRQRLLQRRLRNQWFLRRPRTQKAPPLQRGGVLHKVLPEVSQSARNTITGTVKVGVRVDVDSSGKVTAAKFTSAGPSKYFAGLAMKAAQRWEFTPPEVNGTPSSQRVAPPVSLPPIVD